MMAVENVIGKILSHQLEGLMMHEQMAEYYRFLGMDSYAESHDWHYSQESSMFKFIRDYYITHYNRLPPKVSAHNPNVIPDGWYKYNRDEVDNNTKKNAVRNGLQMWRNWEEETKKLYQTMYTELMNEGEIAFASSINALIVSVDTELSNVIGYCIKHKATDYDLDLIM